MCKQRDGGAINAAIFEKGGAVSPSVSEKSGAISAALSCEKLRIMRIFLLQVVRVLYRHIVRFSRYSRITSVWVGIAE